MSKFVRKDNRVVYLPGYGKIGDDRVIEGDYDKYVPSILVRLADVFLDTTDYDSIGPEAVTEVFKVPQLRAKTVTSPAIESTVPVTGTPLTTLEDLERIKPTRAELDELAQIQDIGRYPELLISTPEIVTELSVATEPAPILIASLPINVSVESVVESDNDRPAMATRDQAAAVVAKMKKPRR